MSKPKLALILGSGFSCASKLPSTNDLSKNFLHKQKSDDPAIEQAISNILNHFWSQTFGYSKSSNAAPPLLKNILRH